LQHAVNLSSPETDVSSPPNRPTGVARVEYSYMKYVDYYTALGLPRDATVEQIKKAYRTLARQHHPDMSKATDAEEKFKNVAAAYATLKNPEKRAAYDALGLQQEGAEMNEAHYTQGSQNGHGGVRGSHTNDMDFADFLDSLERGGLFGERHSRARSPMRGQDMEDTVLVELAQALHGCTLHMTLHNHGERRELEVAIPAGVRAGQKLRLRGKGGKGQFSGADGDFYLHIALAPHPRFRVDKQDLYFDLALSPWEAMLGTEITVATLEGEVVLTVPPGSGSGKKLRLRGRGLPKGAGPDAQRGDLYALVRVDVPTQLSPEELQLVEQMQRISAFSPRSSTKGNTP
jgi:curved DNA-binding protein